MRIRRRAPFTVAASLALGLGGLLSACDRHPAAPPPSGLPPLDPSVAAPAFGEAPPVGKLLPSTADPAVPQPGLPPLGHPALPPLHPAVGDEPATPANIPFDEKSVIAGELRLAPALKDKVAAGDVIFLMVRAVGQPGPPLAVRKLVAGAWPMAFSIDSRDAMVPGTKLDGKVTVSARVDKDGDAMSKNPGDVIGASDPIAPPVAKLVVNMDKVL